LKRYTLNNNEDSSAGILAAFCSVDVIVGAGVFKCKLHSFKHHWTRAYRKNLKELKTSNPVFGISVHFRSITLLGQRFGIYYC